MKILVGIVLVVIGLGVGVTVYKKFGGAAKGYLNYRVSATPSSDTIARGNSKDVLIPVTTNVGFDKKVNLKATGVPDNVKVSFNPSSGTPTFGSTMTVTVGSNAPVKSQTITIKGTTNAGDEKTATYELTIE